MANIGLGTRSLTLGEARRLEETAAIKRREALEDLASIKAKGQAMEESGLVATHHDPSEPGVEYRVYDRDGQISVHRIEGRMGEVLPPNDPRAIEILRR